jgi:hypothetical protein
VIAGEAMVGSWGLILSEGGVIADEAAVGSCGHAPSGERPAVDKATASPFGKELTTDAATIGSCRS